VLALAAVSSVLALAPMAAAAAPADRFDAYTTAITPTALQVLRAQGIDATASRVGGRLRLGLVLTPGQRAELAARGVPTAVARVGDGRTLRQVAAAQAAGGYTVWRSWDQRGGIRDQLRRIARRNPRIAKLETIGRSGRGRPILALKLTRGARRRADGSRPSVLFVSTQHAREWISTEVNRRLLVRYVDRWRAGEADARRTLRRVELWFVLVANPDGYQYTFDSERLWRKTLRDNDGNGRITPNDGVDPNRNFPSHWGYDEEGSSSLPDSEAYRGPAPASEPETRALEGLLDRIRFTFMVNWHSAGGWLLYGDGWQTATPTADDPISYALAGNLDRPAIRGFHPGLSPDVLYVTNGETTDYAQAADGTLAWTPELSEGCPGCGFLFPDVPALVQRELRRVLPFATSVVESAPHPGRPASRLGIAAPPLVLRSADPYKAGLPDANFTFRYSYGDPQPVAVLARRSLGPVTLRFRVNGGRARSVPTTAWPGGERYTPSARYYHRMTGTVTGTDPGDAVEVWFEARGGRVQSPSFTYRAVSETGNRVLVVAAEDYTGSAPAPSRGPRYLRSYLDALRANGIAADVYDVDAQDRVAPDPLGVLGHYDAVVWYTGDDLVTRPRGRRSPNADRLAMDEILAFRAYMNAGGRVLYTGKAAGEQYAIAQGAQLYDPKNVGPCPNPRFDDRRCLPLFGSAFGGDSVNDVLEYWFGVGAPIPGDGNDPATGAHFPAAGLDVPFVALPFAFGAPAGAPNQDVSSSFVATSGALPPDRFPQFRSWPSSRWSKPEGTFGPHTGERFLYSQMADAAYKRLTREVAVPADGAATLSFWAFYDTEPGWDHLIVEARTPGADDWTTLPDANGHTTQDTGQSCPGGWQELHPQLAHYQTVVDTSTCTPVGTTGAWHAATGKSGGWQPFAVDLSRWAGQTVEVSIAYVTDLTTQGLGVLLDDITLPDGTSTSFEDDLGGWRAGGAPPGSHPNPNDWIPATAASYPVGASITTPDSIILGFGLEGLATPEDRAVVMGRAMGHLLAPS